MTNIWSTLSQIASLQGTCSSLGSCVSSSIGIRLHRGRSADSTTWIPLLIPCRVRRKWRTRRASGSTVASLISAMRIRVGSAFAPAINDGLRNVHIVLSTCCNGDGCYLRGCQDATVDQTKRPSIWSKLQVPSGTPAWGVELMTCLICQLHQSIWVRHCKQHVHLVPPAWWSNASELTKHWQLSLPCEPISR